MAASTAMASSTLRQQVGILSSNALLGGSAVSTRRTGPCYASAIATSSPPSQPPTCSASISTRTGGEETQSTHRREGVISRRETLSAASSAAMAAAVLLAMAPALPAEAKSLEERYAEETTAVIDKIRYTLNLDKTDPGKPDAVATLKAASVDWVAKYRREKKVAGKPSFSNMYSVLNAISGHYNSFGIGYPIPAKRKDRILQEVDDTEKALAKGR
ncbi:hypothetical protein CBR_g50764 [Chara braunii]|uniref:Photosystem II Psb27 protein n=1 Tax=Chara braunii TaxID=69332 RepID=A0A388K633_CHABU|nr:hypothetical protein CBR_g50764 [Chara braunii]|eukprot:GBG65403.1 hypothetical protein CBR_g50764 [Chara braunii]